MAGTRDRIRYLSRGRIVEPADFTPTTTLLDHLRLERGRVGTKEGCNEGDCGACTVVLGEVSASGRMVYRPVNACIQLLGMVDGAEVITVEDLAEKSDGLHPVQAAMVEHHGSQCGFCTPGIVMSLFGLYREAGTVDRKAVTDQLAGNLCRCTGYRPIVDAALDAFHRRGETPSDAFARDAVSSARTLAGMADDTDLFVGDDTGFFAAPASTESLAALALAHPDATFVAGATDVGLWITKQMRSLPKIIWLGRVAGLDRIVDAPDRVEIGAAATYAEAEAAMAAIDPDLGELWRRIGSKQVRASGTVGGNVANGSPIGDTPPALIALGATLELRLGDAVRTMPIEDFFLAYGRQDRRPGEFVSRILVPKLAPGLVFRATKISKRFDQDISAVMGAFRFRLDGGRVVEARIAYGGMAATPKRAAGAEAAAVGIDLADRATWAPALAAIGADFTPLSDMRASAGYRARVAAALLEKALVEIAGAPTTETRLVGHREAAHDAVA